MKKTLFALAASAAIVLPAAHAAAHPQRGPVGDITLEDVREHSAERFAKVDADGNGLVTKAEMEAMHDVRRAKMGERAAKGGERAERRMKRMEQRMGRHADRFDRLDNDNDGAISLAELQVRPLEMFARADADNNGVVTEEERRAAHQAMRAERRGRRGQ